MKYRKIAILAITLACSALGKANMLPAEIEKPSVLKTAEPVPNPVIDFETYQRNIDDMFRIALMASPEVDNGINSVIVDLNRKIAENPENVESIIALGHVYRILGQPAEANRFYQKALKLNPDNFHLNIFSAMTNIQVKNFNEALQELSRAVEKNPMDVYARLARGRMDMILRKYQEAAGDFQKALEVQPDNRQAAFALSLAYQALGQNAKAMGLLNQLKEKNPEDLFIRYHLGALAMAEGNPGQAVEYWEGLFKAGVRDIQFLFNLAIAYLQSDQGEKGKIIVDHLSFFFPREVDLDFLMAETYRQMNLLEEAERRYRLVVAEDPYYLSALIGLAEVLGQQGKVRESRKTLKQAELSAREITLREAAIQKQQEIKKIEASILGHLPNSS